MMTTMMPRRNRSLFHELMSDPFEPFFSTPPAHHVPGSLMRTDIKQTDAGFELIIDLPGFDKENVSAQLKEGILTIKAQTKTSTSEDDPQGVWIRKERFSGQCTRSFFVGEDIEEADVTAKFENGTLQISVPKKVEQPKLDQPHTIAIG